MKRVFIKSLIATVALAAMGVASAQDRTIKFANQNAPGHPIVQGMEKFKEIVEKQSGGKLKVNLFPAGALGSDQANVSAIQGGTLEMASMNSGIFASQVKDFAVFDFPFMFASGQEADAVVDGAFGKKMHAKLEGLGRSGLLRAGLSQLDQWSPCHQQSVGHRRFEIARHPQPHQRGLGQGLGCEPHTAAIS
jgi:TRAP-type C4-dicarboxylate transport system substrate-binding protein